MAQQVNKTFLSVWNWDGQEVDSKMSMTEVMKVMIFSRDGHYLFGGSDTGTFRWLCRDCVFVGDAFGDID